MNKLVIQGNSNGEMFKLAQDKDLLLQACKALIESIDTNEIIGLLPHKEEMLRAAVAQVDEPLP